MVEHDRDTIEAADWILDLGPGAGNQGGEIVCEGTLQDVLKSKNSLTGRYLRGEFEIACPRCAALGPKTVSFESKAAARTTSKRSPRTFPLGYSLASQECPGSGKSTLVIDTLYRSLVQTSL